MREDLRRDVEEWGDPLARDARGFRLEAHALHNEMFHFTGNRPDGAGFDAVASAIAGRPFDAETLIPNVTCERCHGPGRRHVEAARRGEASLDMPFGLGIPRMILAAVIVLFGLFPAILFDVINTASVPFIRGLP